MKYFYVLLLICISSFVQAKNEGELFFPHSSVKVNSEQEANSFLKNYFSDLQSEDITLALSFKKNTPYSRHFTFDILVKQVAVLNASIKLNTDLVGNVVSIKKEVDELALLATANVDAQLANANNINANDWLRAHWSAYPSLKNQSYKLTVIDNKPILVVQADAWNKTLDKSIIIDLQGNILQENNNARYLNIDTTLHVQIFKPDPLTSLGFIYGGIHIDDTDKNNAWFNPAYLTADVPGTYDNLNNTFYLENQWVAIDDYDLPTAAPATSATATFTFNRSESGFEDGNVLYHISNFQNHLYSLGYDTLMDVQASIDTHALNGADNSVFMKNGGNPTIAYGTGGVDDAEDADVIIHEYSHGISWSANNNSFTSTDRSGLDEGLADYFATSYSREINVFDWEKMFTWDGHNEFWNGRIANTSANYPATGGLYAVGEIWNSAMSSIWADLGRTVTDKLMLESLHFFANNTNLPEAAMYVLQADTLLFGGIHTTTICAKFQQRNILSANCMPVAVKDVEASPNIRIRNTVGFAKKEGNISIDFAKPSTGKCLMTNILGNTVWSQTFDNTTTQIISPTDLQPGLYVLQVFTQYGKKTFKLNTL